MNIKIVLSFLSLALAGLFVFTLNNLQASDLPVSGDYEAVIIDVRSDEEYNAGHIEGALHIVHTDIGSEIEKFVTDRDTPINVYCASGRRAGIAKETLDKMGYTNVTNKGGYEEYKEELERN